MTNRLLLLLMLSMLTFFIGVAADRLVSTGQGLDHVPAVKEPGPALSMPLCAPEFRLPVSVASPTPIVILDYEPEKFAPTAGYSYSSIGATPAKFREIYSVSFVVDRPVGEKPSVELFIYTESGGPQPAVFALITEKRLFFVTAPSSAGIEYRFDGQYLRPDLGSESAEGKVVLKGILTKSQNGQKLAEGVVKFQVIYDHC
jgi:hypothetical protein